MENRIKILEGCSDPEKGAYLCAIASIASADRCASPVELQYLSDLCDVAELSEKQKATVLLAAEDESGRDLTQCLDVLKKSELKYSLVTDLMAFAKSDGDYSDEERASVERISKYLGIDEQQASLLDEFSDKAKTVQPALDEISQPTFLSSIGLKEKMQNAGINVRAFLKGLLGISGPMLLARMITHGLRHGSTARSFAGFSNMFGHGNGLRSLVDMLSAGRSMNSSRGLFARILRGSF